MKKFLLSLAIAVLSLTVAFAQSSHKVDRDEHYIVLNKSKVISTAGDSIEYHVYDMTEVGDVYYYSIPLKFNSAAKTATSTTPYINVLLQYSHDGENYSNIDTVNYACSADTSFAFVQNTTKVGYAYLRVYMDGADSISARWNRIIGRFVY